MNVTETLKLVNSIKALGVGSLLSFPFCQLCNSCKGYVILQMKFSSEQICQTPTYSTLRPEIYITVINLSFLKKNKIVHASTTILLPISSRFSINFPKHAQCNNSPAPY